MIRHNYQRVAPAEVIAQRRDRIDDSGADCIVELAGRGVCAGQQAGRDLGGCFIREARTQQCRNATDVGGGEGRSGDRNQFVGFTDAIDQSAATRSERFDSGARRGERYPWTEERIGHRLTVGRGESDCQHITSEPARGRDGPDLLPIAGVRGVPRIDIRILIAHTAVRIARTGHDQRSANMDGVTDGLRQQGLIDRLLHRHADRLRHCDHPGAQIRRMRDSPRQRSDIGRFLLHQIVIHGVRQADGVGVHPNGDDPGVRSHPREPVRLVGGRADDAGDQRAVGIAIGEAVTAGLNVVATADEIGQPGVGTGTGVEHRDRDAATPAQ